MYISMNILYLIFIKDLRQQLEAIRNKSKTNEPVVLRFIIEYFVFGGLGFFGLVLIFLGVVCLVSWMKS